MKSGRGSDYRAGIGRTARKPASDFYDGMLVRSAAGAKTFHDVQSANDRFGDAGRIC
ncbi:hypothetical protein [Methylobacterium durans]|uniref:hypothetical protein n=1 Tax=Methylobacterium durans TaxID=2202825 RepID=UPI0013A59FB6|nr:hypothetical protein [Methylobacterium durans]